MVVIVADRVLILGLHCRLDPRIPRRFLDTKVFPNAKIQLFRLRSSALIASSRSSESDMRAEKFRNIILTFRFSRHATNLGGAARSSV